MFNQPVQHLYLQYGKVMRGCRHIFPAKWWLNQSFLWQKGEHILNKILRENILGSHDHNCIDKSISVVFLFLEICVRGLFQKNSLSLSHILSYSSGRPYFLTITSERLCYRTNLSYLLLNSFVLNKTIQ